MAICYSAFWRRVRFSAVWFDSGHLVPLVISAGFLAESTAQLRGAE